MSLIQSRKHPAMKVREEYRDHDDLLVLEGCPELAGLSIRTAIDAGAALGGFARVLLDQYPGAQVLCLEPLGQNVRVLEANLPNVSITQAALTYRGNEAGFVEFHCIKDPAHHGTGGHCIEPFHSPELFEPIPNVAALTVEEAMLSMGWDSLDLLKLDIEGEELDVLARMDVSRVRAIHLEYHLGAARTMAIVNEYLPGWSVEPIQDGAQYGIMLLRAP